MPLTASNIDAVTMAAFRLRASGFVLGFVISADRRRVWVQSVTSSARMPHGRRSADTARKATPTLRFESMNRSFPVSGGRPPAAPRPREGGAFPDAPQDRGGTGEVVRESCGFRDSRAGLSAPGGAHVGFGRVGREHDAQ